MIHALVQVQVEDFEHFWSGFQTRGFPLRQGHGSKGAQVFRHEDAPSQVTILFQWQSRRQLEAFMADPRVKESQKKGTMVGTPVITFLSKQGELDA